MQPIPVEVPKCRIDGFRFELSDALHPEHHVGGDPQRGTKTHPGCAIHRHARPQTLRHMYVNATNFLYNGLKEAFDAARSGGESALLDQMFQGINIAGERD